MEDEARIGNWNCCLLLSYSYHQCAVTCPSFLDCLNLPKTSWLKRSRTLLSDTMPSRRASSATATEHGDAASGASSSNAATTEYDEAVANLQTMLARLGGDFEPNAPRTLIEEASLAVIIDWAAPSQSEPLYNEDALLRSNKLWKVITTDKEGHAKDLDLFLTWARRVVAIREDVLQDRKSLGTATEHAPHVPVLSEDEVQECYRLMGQQLLENDLLPHQMNDRKYIVRFTERGRVQLSTFQRSFTDNMLRKFLGDKKVAMYIWTNGLPMLFDRPMLLHRTATEHSETLDMLQSTMDDALRWYAALARSIVQYEARPELEVRRELGAKKKVHGSRCDGKLSRQPTGPCGKAGHSFSGGTREREHGMTCPRRNKRPWNDMRRARLRKKGKSIF